MILYLNILGLFLFSFFALPTIYQLQIKEYYYPRVLTGMRERTGFFIPLRFPAIKPRNILIFSIVFFVLLLYYYFINRNFDEVTWLYIILWAMGTFIAKIVAFIAMLVTEPLAAFRRGYYMRKASSVRDLSNSKFIGITGSYGKSSVKDLLIQVLSSKYNVAGTSENLNSEVGVALSILKNLKPDTHYYVSEMGAYTLGAIERSCEIVKPDYGFITGIGNQHLALFESKENLIDAKSELIESLPIDGKLYINKDFPESIDMAKSAPCEVTTYSIEDKSADIYVEMVEPGKISILYNDISQVIPCKIDIKHQILNLTGVIAFALDHGMSIDEIVKVIPTLALPRNKLQKHQIEDGPLVIEDTYNSNLDGFLSALNYLSAQKEIEKSVFTKGIIELGEQKNSSYKQVTDFCEENDITIYTTDPYFREVSNGGSKIEIILEEAIEKMIAEMDKDHAVLLEGRFSPKIIKKIRKRYE